MSTTQHFAAVDQLKVAAMSIEYFKILFYLIANQSGSNRSHPSTLWMHTELVNFFLMKNTVLAGK